MKQNIRFLNFFLTLENKIESHKNSFFIRLVPGLRSECVRKLKSSWTSKLILKVGEARGAPFQPVLCPLKVTLELITNYCFSHTPGHGNCCFNPHMNTQPITVCFSHWSGSACYLSVSSQPMLTSFHLTKQHSLGDKGRDPLLCRWHPCI